MADDEERGGADVTRRQLLFAGDRGLLRHAVGPRVRPSRQVRPRVRRAESAGGQWSTSRTAARSRSSGMRTTFSGSFSGCSRTGRWRCTSTCRSRPPPECTTTRCSATTATSLGLATYPTYSVNERAMLSLASLRGGVQRAWHRSRARLGRGGRRSRRAHRGSSRTPGRDQGDGGPGADQQRSTAVSIRRQEPLALNGPDDPAN